MRQELITLMAEKSFQFSSEPVFKLVSGAMSRFYVNCKPTTLNPRGMFLIGHIIFEMVEPLHIHGLGGLTFGADPIAVAVAFASELKGSPINAFSIRKTQKDHGIIKWVEGDVGPGNRVVILDDVATTGGSTIQAIERARSEGLVVVKAVILVDRQEGGLEHIQQHVDACAVLTKDDLLAAGKTPD
ncbi:MAG: orotate phosphoribosyltransferase [Desulfobacterales bacterium]